MTDIRLLNDVSANGESPYRTRVSANGGVNVYATFGSLGGGTLNIYECPDNTLKPNVPVYSSATGEPKHLNVAAGSYLLGELTGATSATNVTLGAVTLDEESDR